MSTSSQQKIGTVEWPAWLRSFCSGVRMLFLDVRSRSSLVIAPSLCSDMRAKAQEKDGVVQ